MNPILLIAYSAVVQCHVVILASNVCDLEDRDNVKLLVILAG